MHLYLPTSACFRLQETKLVHCRPKCPVAMVYIYHWSVLNDAIRKWGFCCLITHVCIKIYFHSFGYWKERKEGKKKNEKGGGTQALRFFLFAPPMRGHLVDKIRTANIRNNVGRERSKWCNHQYCLHQPRTRGTLGSTNIYNSLHGVKASTHKSVLHKLWSNGIT